MKKSDCIFCKIIEGEIPCDKIYEDENFLSFLNIEPVSNGHILIIPKIHVVWMQEADDETVAGIFKITKKLMHAIKNGMKSDYVQISVGGTDVPHFHVHLVPRYLNDGFTRWPTKKYNGDEAKEIVSKIISAL